MTLEQSKMERYFVKDISSLTNTPSGNPRFKFIVADRYGETKVLHTKADAMFNHKITHDWTNRMIEGYTHTTSRNIILDHADLAEKHYSDRAVVYHEILDLLRNG